MAAPRRPRLRAVTHSGVQAQVYPWVNWSSDAGCSPRRGVWSGTMGLPVGLRFRCDLLLSRLSDLFGYDRQTPDPDATGMIDRIGHCRCHWDIWVFPCTRSTQGTFFPWNIQRNHFNFRDIFGSQDLEPGQAYLFY